MIVSVLLFPNLIFSGRADVSLLLHFLSTERLQYFSDFYSVFVFSFGWGSFCSGAQHCFPHKLIWLPTSSHLKQIQLWKAEDFRRTKGQASHLPCVIKIWIQRCYHTRIYSTRSHITHFSTLLGRQYGFGVWLNELFLALNLFLVLLPHASLCVLKNTRSMWPYLISWSVVSANNHCVHPARLCLTLHRCSCETGKWPVCLHL